VDAQNGNDNNDGRSPTTAWRTLDKVASARPNGYAAGNHILFRRGQTFQSTARPTIKALGTATSPVVIGAYGEGAAPRLDNNGPQRYDVVLTIQGSYALVRNLAVIKANTANRTQVGIDLLGKGHRVTATDISGVGNGVRITGSDHRVDNTSFHDLTMVVDDTSNPDNDYGATGVLISKASNISVDHNRFERLRAPSPDYGVDGSALEFFDAATNVRVHNNIIKDVVTFTEMGGSSSTDVIKGIKFHHNLVINAGKLGVFHNSTAGTNFGLTITDVRFEHNTLIKNTTDYGSSTGYGLLGFVGAPAANQFFFRNNIVDYRNINRLFYNPGQLVHQNNLYSLTNASFGSDFTPSPSEITGSAAFVSPDDGDYRLSAGSPAINRALSLGYASDLKDLPMPVGPAPDIGAYEYR
jgi:hypothetical protein